MVKIAHLADIHVRNHSRHAEYRKTFEAFVETCKKDKVDHIFLGGDVFHTKTSGMSPECVDLISWMLKELAFAAQTHIILGNHDFNVVNLQRQDAISPIVQAIDNPRIHLYKMSGVYQFAKGYNWCVFSLCDEENWKYVKPVPGDVNIACYHGPVWDAKTETNWLIEEGLTVDFFKDYDFTFLGDIHRVQYLGFREVEIEIDEKDLSDYPGAEVIS